MVMNSGKGGGYKMEIGQVSFYPYQIKREWGEEKVFPIQEKGHKGFCGCLNAGHFSSEIIVIFIQV